jgi:putative flippase GtrA
MAASNTLGTQFTKFLAVGGAGTVVHYLILIFQVSSMHIAPGPAAFAGAAAGAVVVYVLNYRITFASHAGHAHTLPRFVAVAVVAASLNGGLVGLLTKSGVHFLSAQVAATAIVLVFNFIVSKLWIFR